MATSSSGLAPTIASSSPSHKSDTSGDARNLRQQPRQQSSLQRFGDLAFTLVQVRVLDGHRGDVGELPQQGFVGFGEPPVDLVHQLNGPQRAVLSPQ